MRLTLPTLALALLAALPAHAENWPSFRGKDAAGVGGSDLVTTWNVETSENVLWKTAIPGLAHSSPVVWGDRVFVTTAVSLEGEPYFRHGLYGDVDLAEEDGAFSWRIYAVNKKSGKILWERKVHDGPALVQRHIKATHANSTPATDGKYLVTVFGSLGWIVTYDLDGKLLWKKDVGAMDTGWFYDPSYQWGHASSPTLWQDRVIVQVDQAEGSYIAAFSLADGKELWRTPRNNLPSWGTPAVVSAKSGPEVVTNGAKAIRGYDAKSGKELWSLGPTSEVTIATPVQAHGLVYISHGYRPVQPVYAIRPGGRGDLTLPSGETSSDYIAWSKPRGGNYVTTPLVYGDLLFTLADNGVLTCYDAKSGEQHFKNRVGGGQAAFSGSMVAAGGHLYLPSEDGDVYVVKAAEAFEEITMNTVGEVIMTTPAISDGTLFIRGRNHLFALAPSKAEPAAEAGAAD